MLIPSADQTTVRIELPDGTARDLPMVTVERSSILSTAIATDDARSEVTCPHLESWIRFNDISPRSRGNQADDTLIKAAEVSSPLSRGSTCLTGSAPA